MTKTTLLVVTTDVVEHNSSKMVYSKAHVDSRLRSQIVWVVRMVLVLLGQQRHISSLWKLAFLVDKCEDVEWLDGNQLKSFFVVNELDMLPVDHLIVVFLLLPTHTATNPCTLPRCCYKLPSQIFCNQVPKQPNFLA